MTDPMDGKSPISLAEILAPMSEEEFFRDYYDKRPLHIPNMGPKKDGFKKDGYKKDGHKFQGLMDWSVLNDLLTNSGQWTSKTLALQIDRQSVPAPLYCESREDRAGNRVMQPVVGKVMDLLHQGASLVAIDIDMMTAPLRRTAAAFEAAFDAKAQANLYCSWNSRQAFNSHFDTHDVFALHIEGEKVWRVYETRMPHPIRHPRHENSAYGEVQHQEQRGDVLMEVMLRPGDVLYLPRGQYHDALASSSGTVHIAFGITGLIGIDALGALQDFAVEDEAFRRNLPRAAEGPEAMRAVLQDLSARLAVLAEDPVVLESLLAYQATWRYDRSNYALPIMAKDRRFRVAGPQFKLVRDKGAVLLAGPRGAVPIPPGSEETLRWILSRRDFGRGDFMSAHGRIPVTAVDKLLGDLKAMGVLSEV